LRIRETNVENLIDGKSSTIIPRATSEMPLQIAVGFLQCVGLVASAHFP